MDFFDGVSGPENMRILVADTDCSLARRLAAAFAKINAQVEIASADSITVAEHLIGSTLPSAIILGLDLDAEGLRLVERVRARSRSPLIVLSDAGSVSLAVEAMRRGADDFLTKPVAAETLVRRVLARMNDGGAPSRNLSPASAEAPVIACDFEGFVGQSEPMREVYAQIERIAPSRAPVFITGESGTGKEEAAAAVHARSRRAEGPFVAINCAAIPHELMESEIFGHVRGAFTGAQDDRAGAAELANGGTLFLDEICEMDLALQAKLLRLIQTGEVRRVGGGSTNRVDVRFICATNRNAQAEVSSGRFREDLYYRLHVLPLALPALRERSGDIIRLARAFLARFSAEEGRAFTGLSPDAELRLALYPWPGNVRELQNVIRRIVVLHDAPRITADMLPPEFLVDRADTPPAFVQRVAHGVSKAIEPMWRQEQRIIEEALTAFGGNTARAAAALGISPSTIYRKRQGWASGVAAE